MIWWAAVQLQQVSDAITGSSSGETLSVLGPAIGGAGLMLVGFAISQFAQARGLEALREAAGVRTLAYVMLTAGSIGAQHMVYASTAASNGIMLTFVSAGAVIGALLAFAGLAKQAADAIDKGPSLPEARVVSTSQP